MRNTHRSILSNEKGFTLIEIIAVLVILGILAAVAVPKYIDLQTEARLRSAHAAIAEVKARLSMSYGKVLLETGVPPVSIVALCDTVADANLLPAGAVGSVPMGADYTVDLAADGTITVKKVQGVPIISGKNADGTDIPVTGTWTLP